MIYEYTLPSHNIQIKGHSFYVDIFTYLQA